MGRTGEFQQALRRWTNWTPIAGGAQREHAVESFRQGGERREIGLLRLEQNRLANILGDWLEVEAQRARFHGQRP